MGIPGLYGRWLAKNNRQIQAIRNGMPHNVASLSLDLNGIFHEARMKVFAGASVDPRIKQAIEKTDPIALEAEIHTAVANIILGLVQLAQPQDCLILSVDGVAPGAKMQQQRGRRERTAYESEPGTTFDSNAITPGTDFMFRMSTYMQRFIGMYRDYLPSKIIYSSHLVPGEGEHKIMDYYRRGDVNGPASQNGGAHVIHGLDADFIMLAVLSPVDNIYLSRETDEGLVTVHIDALKQYLVERTRKPTIIEDFVIIMMLMGNDFLPHFPAFADMADSIDHLIDLYAAGDYDLTIPDPNTNEGGLIRRHINWEDMKRYIAVVAASETTLLETVSKRRFRNPSRFFNVATRGGTFNYDTFRAGWYQNALGPKGSKELNTTLLQILGRYVPTQAEYDVYGERVIVPIESLNPISVTRIEKMTLDYMRIMAWVYLYYREGTAAINQDLAYMYYHTPMLADLSATMQTINQTHNILGYEAYPEMKPFTALHQLVAVLPLKSRNIVPVELQPLFDYNSIIRDFFPHSFIIERDGTDQPYQGIPIIPLIDRQRVLDAVAQIAFTPHRAKIWVPETEEIFERSPEEMERIQQLILQQQRSTAYTEQQKAAREARRGARTGGEGGYTPRGRGDGERPQRGSGFVPRGRGEGGFVPRGRGEGGFVPRGRGDGYIPRGRGDGGYVPRGRGEGGYIPRGRGSFSPQLVTELVPTMSATQGVKSPGISVRGSGTQTRGRGIPSLGGVSPQPISLPSLGGAAPQPIGLPSLGGAAPQPIGLPSLGGAAPQPIGLPSLGGAAPQPIGLPSLGGAAPQPIGLPSLGGVAPQPIGLPSLGGAAPQPIGLPSLGGVAPQPIGLPSLGGVSPQPIGLPSLGLPSLSGSSLPSLSGTSQSGAIPVQPVRAPTRSTPGSRGRPSSRGTLPSQSSSQRTPPTQRTPPATGALPLLM